MNTRDLSAATWRKSSYSNGQGGECVEVATVLPALVAIRDSKNLDQPALAFPPSAWRAFLAKIRLSSERIVPPSPAPLRWARTGAAW